MEITTLQSKSFETWLKTLGYAQSTVYLSGMYVRDFFFYLKSQQVTKLENIKPSDITNYHSYLQTRNNKRQTGGLSQNYISSNINALKRYSRYLQETGKQHLEITIKTKPDKETPKTILSIDEIRTLYKVCDNTIAGLRDKAIVSIYYGCGLRRNEGVSLNMKDLKLQEKLLHITAGKGGKERYVPITQAIKEHLETYIYQSREYIQNDTQTKNEALFLNMQGNRMSGNTILSRVQMLVTKAGINKTIGLHSLRHSIATHLLKSGLPLEELSRFLGHSSLESTQIYTHISHE